MSEANEPEAKVEDFTAYRLETVGKDVFIVPTDTVALRSFIGQFGVRPPKDRFLLQDAVDLATGIIRRIGDDDDCVDLCAYLRRLWAAKNQHAIGRVSERQSISFEHLSLWFADGTEVYVPDDGGYGAVVIGIEERSTFAGRWIGFQLRTIEHIGKYVVPRGHWIRMRGYVGEQPLSQLPLARITPEQKAVLAERGRAFRDLAQNGQAQYRSYRGRMVVQNWWSDQSYRSDGRVMIDGAGLQRFDDDQLRCISHNRNDINGIRSDQSIHIDDESLWLCSPYVYGYSLVCKGWGQFRVDGIGPVNFRDDAIDKLVMDPGSKALVLALVQHGDGAFSDIIEGKGGGRILLLEGSPGVGKTLTAEAVAECLRRPLYSISVGELGTTPEDIETALQELLELATTWNAVLLLDEADIFLEKRATGDVLRNAMVGVFLRLLEYHQGVLFLTSNRVQDFDPAFKSRISVTLHYPEMGYETRVQVWRNLLAAAGITTLDPEEMARLAEVNGRQIKNLVRCSAILAKSQGVEVGREHVEQCVRLLGEPSEERPVNGHSRPGLAAVGDAVEA